MTNANIRINDTILCEQVELANSFFSKVKGRMFTRRMPKDLGLVFSFEYTQQIPIHMFFVPYDLGVIWVNNETVVDVQLLSSWIDRHSARADTVIEVHPSTLKHVTVGDSIEINHPLYY